MIHIFYLKGTYLLVVEKSKYELSVYDDDGWYATYPVVFGSKDLGDKMREGDRKTPEGTFTIISKKVHEKWDRFMMLDYPTQESYQKFNDRKAHGLIPRNATIGGGIGIHGTWPREDYAIDRYDNWDHGLHKYEKRRCGRIIQPDTSRNKSANKKIRIPSITSYYYFC
jgi:murein L,D-transpeptidase YafK